MVFAAADLQCLYQAPDQAGFLNKRSHTHMCGFQERFFLLKGSYLFYFKSRQNVKRLQGVIPLENAKVEAEPSHAPGSGAQKAEAQAAHHRITITLHVQHAYSAKHPFYELQAPSDEVQAAWANALWQAAVPRSSMIAHLQEAGLLCNVVAEYAQQLQLCFPTADAAVLSSSGRARLSGLGNVGQLAGALRRHKIDAPMQDMAQPLPTVPSPAHAAGATILARTESGTVVPAVVTHASGSPPPAPPVAAPQGHPGKEGKSVPFSRLSLTATTPPAAVAPHSGKAAPQWHPNPLAASEGGDDATLKQRVAQQEKQREALDATVPSALAKAAAAN